MCQMSWQRKVEAARMEWKQEHVCSLHGQRVILTCTPIMVTQATARARVMAKPLV